MTVPRRLTGVWEREHLRIGGRTVREIGRAIWIEAGGRYIDVRAPGRVASGTSFAGRSVWRAPRFTWHHDVDLHPAEGRADRGDLTIEGDALVERGTGLDGSARRYEERWRRLAGPSAPHVVAHARGVAIRLGNHAAALLATGDPDTGGACLWERADSGWVPTITLGAARLPTPTDAGWRPTRGWQHA